MEEASHLIRPMAVLALLATVIAQSVAPAIKGVAMGMGRVIDGIDVAAGIVSHLLAIATTALAIGLILLIARDRKINILVRILLIAQTAVILILGVPAARFRLSAFACFFIGLVACGLALVSSLEGMRQPRSRAPGLVLAVTTIAALLRMIPAAILSLSEPARAESFQPLASLLASVSAVVFGAAVFMTLAWLAARGRRLVAPVSTIVLAASMVLTWGALRGEKPDAPAWTLFLSRAMTELVPDPTTLLPQFVVFFIAALAPLTAVAAISSRRQIPAVLGALALTVTAGSAPDVPGRALILALASLSVVLASRDDRGMWAALIGRPLAPNPPPSSGG